MKTKLTLIIAIISVFSSHFAFAKAMTHTARVYCFYIPKSKVQASGQEQARSLTYEKLLTNASESKKVGSIFNTKTRVFLVDILEYNNLIQECKNFIKDKGEMYSLRGTDAAHFEKLTYFYDILPEGKNKILTFSAEDIIQEIDKEKADKLLNLGSKDQEELKETIINNSELIKTINEKLSDSKLEELAQSKIPTEVQGAEYDYYITQAITVAAFLASVWFGQAYISAGVEFLYPFVYQALWGIPAKTSLSYWLVYYPGKVHAAAWAYNNSAAIITAGTAMLSLGKAAIDNFAQRFRKDLKEKKVKSDLQELSSSIIAK